MGTCKKTCGIKVNQKVAKTKTDNNGTFGFSAIDYMMVADTNNLTLTATGPNSNKKVRILIDYPYRHKISAKIIEQSKRINGVLQLKSIETLTKDNQKEISKNEDEVNSSSGFTKSDIKIHEVDVKADRGSIIPKEVYKKEFMVYELKEKDVKLISGSNKEAIFHLIQKAAGNFRVEDGGKILFRGNNSILLNRQQGAAIVIDGMFKGFDWQVLEFLSVYDIESIRVIKSAAAAARYTSFALGGLIEVKTKNGFTANVTQKQIKKASNLAYVNGFQVHRSYYSPKYTKKENKQEKFDPRKTIYWDPNIKPDKSGLTKINFYTSDMPGSYLLKFEGTSKEGRIFYLVNSLQVVR